MNVFVGIIVLMLCHVGAVLLLGLLIWSSSIIPVASQLAGIAVFGIFGIGLTQLLYVVPLCIWLHRQGRVDTAKGVIIGAVLTLLLNGGCFIVMLEVLRGV
ncbi:MAG: hypothetical protein WBB01_03915 [Phormidesmis sp.]